MIRECSMEKKLLKFNSKKSWQFPVTQALRLMALDQNLTQDTHTHTHTHTVRDTRTDRDTHRHKTHTHTHTHIVRYEPARHMCAEMEGRGEEGLHYMT